MKITDLPLATDLNGSETVPIVKDDETQRASLGSLAMGSYRKVATIADREAIPLVERVYGMRVYVVGDDPAVGGHRMYEWVPAGSLDPMGNIATVTDWVGLYTEAEMKNLGIGFTNILPAGNVEKLPGALTDASSIFAVKIADFKALASSSAANPTVSLSWSVKGTLPDAQTITWAGYSVALDGRARSFTPPNWSAIPLARIAGNSISDPRDDNSTTVVHWPTLFAAAAGMSVVNDAAYSSDWVEALRFGVAPIMLTIAGGVLPVGGTSASIAAINGTAPGTSPSDGVSFLSVGDSTVVSGCTMTGRIADRHVTVSVPNGGSAAYSIVQDAGGAAVTLTGPVQFIPDHALSNGAGVVINATGQNYFYASIPQTYQGHTGYFNAGAFANDALFRASARGWPVLEFPVLPQADWATTGAGNPYDAMTAFNALRETFAPQCKMRDNAGRTMLQRLQSAAIPGDANDAADVAARLIPRSLRIFLGGTSYDPLHPSVSVNAGQTVSGQQVIAAFVQEALANVSRPPVITQTTIFTLSISGAQTSNGAVSQDSANTPVKVKGDIIDQTSVAGLPSALSDLRTSLVQIQRVDTMGRAAITSTDTTGANAGTYVFANAVTRSGTRTVIRVRNPAPLSTTLYLGRFTFDGTNFTPVPGTAYVPVAIPAITGTATIAINFFVGRGEYIGWTVSEAGKGVAYTLATAGDNGGYYVNTGVQQPTTAFAAGGKITGIQLQIGFDCNYALVFDDAASMVNAVSATLATTNAALVATTATATLARSGNTTATFGRAAITSTSTTVASGGTFIFQNVAVHSGTRHTLRFRNGATSAQTVYLGRFAFDGTNYSQVAGTSYYPVTIPAGPGTFAIPISFYLARGERLGLSVPVNVLVYDLGAGDSGGYVYTATQQPSGTFAPTSSTTGIILQFGADVDYALAYDDQLAVVQPQIDAHTAAIASNTSAIATNAAGLAAITTKSLTAAGNARPQINANFAPANFYEWATGIVNGDNVLDGKTIQAVGVQFQFDGTAARVEAQLYSRPSTASYINASPGNAGDTAEWTAPVSVPVANLGFAAGAFGSYNFVSPTGQAPLATGKSFYLLLRAFDSSGNRVVIGCGNSGPVTGAAGALLARGFYRQVSATAAWTPVSSTTSSLNVTAYDYAYSVAASGSTGTTATSAPRKDQGLAIYWGRAELVVDNTNLYTMRRIFAVPANVKRVRRVIFAHATTTGGLEVTRAAVAPLASAANFAASGVTWTGLTFGGGTAKGTIPVAAATQRNGWMASIDNPLTLLDRTDVVGAAKLVCVSAYLGGGGSPVLLGNAANTDDYSAWANRTDFPMVMRRMAGDCVTTPANFTDTTNQIAGTCIAGLLVETDSGELLTIGYTGDSITNGAGASAYGFGWAARLSYNLNVKFRGSCPVLLGWSGISMQGIANIATDFYAFVKAQALPAPNLFFTPNASPNSITAPNTQAQMDAQRVLSDQITATAVGAGSKVVSWTIIPTDPSVKNTGASDSYRVAYNAADRTQAGLQRGLVLADMDTIMAGSTDANGQVNMNPLLQADHIHPGDAGHDAMAGGGERAARVALPAAGYAIGGVVA